MTKRHGKCLCGSVEIEIDVVDNKISACHCDMCRRWSGGPFTGHYFEGDVTWKGEKFIGIYKSSDWAERGFCKKCGSNLFWRMSETQTSFATGLFDDADQNKFEMSVQYFIDEKPEFYTFSNDCKTMTSEDIMKEFGPSDT
ncbi:GFA family protein [Terasakiella sp. A23]|uniref:GFA family protein n=1 Tax=Terasakiella sp. FCG-A23 TaxID=3080561 RepID=UPI00295418A5|nr:GFA family protein [Terasakiella sp. A23]MDV7338961.1 GFA family protein [Terasakiella sp. A23]